MFARVVECVADPMALSARIVERRFPALLLTAPTPSMLGRYSWLACDPDGEANTLDPMGGAPLDRAIPAELASFPQFIGVIPYEARRALERPLWSPIDERPAAPMSSTHWLRYPAVARVDSFEGRVLVAGTSRSAVDDLSRSLRNDRAGEGPREESPRAHVEVEDDEPHHLHVERIARAIELIKSGDLYQVNLARRIGLRLVGEASTPALLSVFARLARAAPSTLGAFISTHQGTLLSTSPELCLDAAANHARTAFGRLSTEPIKGTRPRGADAEADRQLALELDADPKERAELAMIIDVERNDLHRVAAPGSVRLLGPPRVVAHRTVHHRVATLTAIARRDQSREDVLGAMVPSGSVTGAPKIRAMEVIRSLEPMRRGLYTGAFGYQSHDGAMRLAMAIRTAVFEPSGLGEYLVGGGIVVGSSPERELSETQWKAVQLRALLG